MSSKQMQENNRETLSWKSPNCQIGDRLEIVAIALAWGHEYLKALPDDEKRQT